MGCDFLYACLWLSGISSVAVKEMHEYYMVAPYYC